MSFLSKDEIEDIVNNPMVQTNKEKLSTGNSINFSIPLTDTMKIKLEQLGIDVSQMTSIPMRWITGDTAPHKDKGQSQFKNTHLIYLTDSVGNLIVDGQSYPIVAGEAHTFREGLEHYTINTVGERLMMGPMSESGFRVGATYYPIYFYTDDKVVTGGDPVGFLYFTPPQSSIYGTITIFDFPPAPVTQQGLYFIQNIRYPADWTPPPGKTFGGWKYLNLPGFAPIVSDPSHIYRPGETYEYSDASILIPNWIDLSLPPRFSLHFSNNAMVYYKPHSLSSGGSGVRNYRHKRRKT